MRYTAPNKLYVDTEKRAGKNRRRVYLVIRVILWILAAGVVCGFFSGVWYGGKKVFFLDNPRFTLQKIDVTIYGGSLKPEKVKNQLKDMGIKKGETNLFAIDLRQRRKELLESAKRPKGLLDWRIPPVKSVKMWRRMPNTLVVQLSEYTPVAQLLKRGGRLIQEDGIVLPPRNERRAWHLPILTGIRNAGSYKIGTEIDGALMESALDLLDLLRQEKFGKYYDVSLIQPDYKKENLVVHLRKQKPFSRNARIIFPGKGKSELKNALAKVTKIVKSCSKGDQIIDFIKADVKNNLPVRRRPE